MILIYRVLQGRNLTSRDLQCTVIAQKISEVNSVKNQLYTNYHPL